MGTSRPWSDLRLFFGEFRRTFRTTGAILPSGRALGRALARHVAGGGESRRILEVGPGTGSVTAAILAAMSSEDRLDLVELNERFVARLRERFEHEPAFRAAAPRVKIIQGRIEDLDSPAPYDVIVSGLPLNNFTAAEVEAILGGLLRLLAPGGVLSFFEYIAVRRAKSLIAGRHERARLGGIRRALEDVFRRHAVRREWVWKNVPPAWVHHVFAPLSGVTYT